MNSILAVPVPAAPALRLLFYPPFPTKSIRVGSPLERCISHSSIPSPGSQVVSGSRANCLPSFRAGLTTTVVSSWLLDSHAFCGVPCLGPLSPLGFSFFLLSGVMLGFEPKSLSRGRSMGRQAETMATLGSTADQSAASA